MGFDQLIRSHQWTPLELFAGLLVVLLLSYVAVDVGGDACGTVRAWWRARQAARFIQGGPPHGYVDPARIHRETRRELDRLAQRAAAHAGAARRVDAGGVVHGAGVQDDAAGEARQGAAPLASGHARVPLAASPRHLDRQSGYGGGSSLVFPARHAPTQRLNGNHANGSRPS